MPTASCGGDNEGVGTRLPPAEPRRDPLRVSGELFSLAAFLMSTAGVFNGWGYRRLAATFALSACVFSLTCGALLVGNWRGLVTRLAQRREEGRYWRIVGHPFVVRTAGTTVFAFSVVIVVVAARRLGA